MSGHNSTTGDAAGWRSDRTGSGPAGSTLDDHTLSLAVATIRYYRELRRMGAPRLLAILIAASTHHVALTNAATADGLAEPGPHE